MKVGIHHHQHSGIVIQLPDNDRHGLHSGKLAGPVPPVTGHQFISSVGVWSGDSRNQYTILPDTICGFHHGFIIPYMKWMVFERVQFR